MRFLAIVCFYWPRTAGIPELPELEVLGRGEVLARDARWSTLIDAATHAAGYQLTVTVAGESRATGGMRFRITFARIDLLLHLQGPPVVEHEHEHEHEHGEDTA
ncbi:MAG: hypothetical protein OXC31_29400 [Spirochaetaceae bacterium]|nr:hypothetical protein [Spirochaetaceae bacterium]